METSYRLRDCIASWNRSTHLWLKKYVYFRVASREEIKRSTLSVIKAEGITFLTSAFWHGFYPGYYIMFVGVMLESLVSKNIERLQPVLFPWAPRAIRILISYIFTNYITGYFAAGFFLLEVSKSLKFYKSYGFFTLYGVLALFVASHVCLKIFGRKLKAINQSQETRARLKSE
jgi:lysophospholipid acyltransferase